MKLYVTESIVQIPYWGANSRSASQEISRLFRNPNIHYRLDIILSKMNSAHTITSFLFKIHSNIILSSTPKCSNWSLPFKNFVSILNFSHACYMHWPSHRPWHIEPNNVWWSSSHDGFVKLSVTSALFGPKIPLSTSLSFLAFSFMRETKFHTHFSGSIIPTASCSQTSLLCGLPS
jgi:hypothetical protein